MDEGEFLQTYDRKAFDAPMATVDVAIFTVLEERLNVLLHQRKAQPQQGRWALPGGIIDVALDRDLESAALRKLLGKTGVATPYLEQVATVGNGERDPRGWSLTVLYFALLPVEGIQLDREGEEPRGRWRPIQGTGVDVELAFDHAELLRMAVERLRNKVAYTALPTHLLPEAFTLTELQRVYEIVLQREIEKSAFRRRIQDAGVVALIPGKKRRGGNRPAQLYRRLESASAHLFPRNLAVGGTD